MDKESEVKLANKEFFDTVADVYEKIDGRRAEDMIGWVDGIIVDLKNKTGGNSLLDLGCGTGLIMRRGEKYFDRVHGIDISPKMVEEAKKVTSGEVVCGDITSLPFDNNSFDVVSCFAVLHHCYDFNPIFREAYRVLRNGGILYTDHDLDLEFMRRFNLPMRIYRKIFDASKKYLKEKKGLDSRLYKLSEYNSGGIETGTLVEQLKSVGFREIEVRYHWMGLNSIINKIFMLLGIECFPRGFAPLFSISALK